MIRVLIVDDSPTVRLTLQTILESDPQIKIVGYASNGREALDRAMQLRPDLITMDVLMPEMDGIDATRLIMAQCPTPIVIVTTHLSDPELEIGFNALQAGAVQVIDKPANAFAPESVSERAALVTTIKLMSEVRVVQRRFDTLPQGARLPMPVQEKLPSVVEVVAIGASTGGPAALNTILGALPADFPAPILIVQHITAGFTLGLAAWLQHRCQLPIHVARAAERIQPGIVYIAPDACHLLVAKDRRLQLNTNALVNHVRPSANVLFESIGRVYSARAIGILLTGMGEDGALGLRAIHQSGGLTIAQDEATSIVYGMPRAAAELGACSTILPIDQIAAFLVHTIMHRR